uniref:G-protein coupled receptors family 1 profile domain-containing protein n=1 Tax=Chrysemys picta bellii TaxID=8478 RepID=A0A8C3HX40_CHRPI
NKITFYLVIYSKYLSKQLCISLYQCYRGRKIYEFALHKLYARQIAKIPRAIKCVSEMKNKISTKKENKATKTLSIVMGVFVFCWLPFFILTIVDPFINFSTPEDLYNAFLWLGYFNSTCNPIIYALFYSWFRKAFKMIVTDSSTLTLWLFLLGCLPVGEKKSFPQLAKRWGRGPLALSCSRLASRDLP